MPFLSKRQRRWMHANHPKMAKRWEEHTPKGANLPEKAGAKRKPGSGVSNARQRALHRIVSAKVARFKK